ncbi:MAG: DUF3426 domain-containing protein, partial [Pseudomonadota bacterium]
GIDQDWTANDDASDSPDDDGPPEGEDVALEELFGDEDDRAALDESFDEVTTDSTSGTGEADESDHANQPDESAAPDESDYDEPLLEEAPPEEGDDEWLTEDALLAHGLVNRVSPDDGPGEDRPAYEEAEHEVDADVVDEVHEAEESQEENKAEEEADQPREALEHNEPDDLDASPTSHVNEQDDDPAGEHADHTDEVSTAEQNESDVEDEDESASNLEGAEQADEQSSEPSHNDESPIEEHIELTARASDEGATNLPPLAEAAERASRIDDRHDRADLMNYLNPGLTPLQKVLGTLTGLLLVVVLGAQVAHQFRADLAQHPRYGDTVRDTYERAGRPIRIPARHRDYDVVRHTVVPRDDEPEVLQVRATVANRSAGLRPPPYVRVTFYDRYGEERFVRTFAPAQYSTSVFEDTLLDAGERIEVELDVVDVDAAATTNYLVE